MNHNFSQSTHNTLNHMIVQNESVHDIFQKPSNVLLFITSNVGLSQLRNHDIILVVISGAAVEPISFTGRYEY
jgi:hypothetical protein